MAKAIKAVYYFVRKSPALELDYASNSFNDLANTLNTTRYKLKKAVEEYDDAGIPELVERVLGHVYYETEHHYIVKSSTLD